MVFYEWTVLIWKGHISSGTLLSDYGILWRTSIFGPRLKSSWFYSSAGPLGNGLHLYLIEACIRLLVKTLNSLCQMIIRHKTNGILASFSWFPEVLQPAGITLPLNIRIEWPKAPFPHVVRNPVSSAISLKVICFFWPPFALVSSIQGVLDLHRFLVFCDCCFFSALSWSC